jgi:hypothetical protein
MAGSYFGEQLLILRPETDQCGAMISVRVHPVPGRRLTSGQRLRYAQMLARWDDGPMKAAYRQPDQKSRPVNLLTYLLGERGLQSRQVPSSDRDLPRLLIAGYDRSGGPASSCF